MKSPLYIALLLTILLPCHLLFAQAENHWGITMGWSEAYVADQHTSPLLYRSDLLAIGGSYQRQAKSFLELSLLFQVGNHQAQRLGKRSGTFNETPDLFGNQESYDFVVNPFLSRISGFFNSRILWELSDHSRLGASINIRYDMAGMSGDTWQYAQADLAPEYQYQRPLFAGQLQARFSLPIIGGIVRPNWAVDPSLPDETNYFKGYLRTGSSITSLHHLFNPRGQFSYQYPLPNGKTLGVAYHIAWLSYALPRPLRMFEQGLQLQYYW
ncbi:MAG: hypothetical protein ACRBG0_12490 [Lewinella sp.]|uniref:hypothetical protein n=1 Tax=Lewinella sp. TaxID=2004506 RepID=UPI003D6B6215